MAQTAITIPDAVFALGERLAEELGISRAELYALAITEFARRLRAGEELAVVQAAQAQLALRAQSPNDEHAAAVAGGSTPHRPTLSRHEAHLLLDDSCWS